MLLSDLKRKMCYPEMRVKLMMMSRGMSFGSYKCCIDLNHLLVNQSELEIQRYLLTSVKVNELKREKWQNYSPGFSFFSFFFFLSALSRTCQSNGQTRSHSRFFSYTLFRQRKGPSTQVEVIAFSSFFNLHFLIRVSCKLTTETHMESWREKVLTPDVSLFLQW